MVWPNLATISHIYGHFGIKVLDYKYNTNKCNNDPTSGQLLLRYCIQTILKTLGDVLHRWKNVSNYTKNGPSHKKKRTLNTSRLKTSPNQVKPSYITQRKNNKINTAPFFWAHKGHSSAWNKGQSKSTPHFFPMCALWFHV